MAEVFFAIVLLLISILIGIIKIVRLDGGLYLQDVRLSFLLTFTLYTIFLPIASCAFPDILSFRKGTFANMIWLYFSAVLAYDIVLFKYNIKWLNPNIRIIRHNKFFLPLIFLILLVLYSYYYMKSQGVTTFALGAGMDDRDTYSAAVHQSWIVLTIVIAVFFNYLFFHYKNLSGRTKIILVSCLLFYFLYQLSMGNRREYVTIALFLLCYYLSLIKKPISLKLFIILVIGFIGSFIITIVRDPNTRDLPANEKVQMAIISNEFVYPQQTTYYMIEADKDLKLGYTYTILPIQIAIPRYIYPNKPMTLGTDFIKNIIDTSQGYAYTPVTEAYLNFGFMGPFIIFLLIAMFLNKLVKEANATGISFKYMIIFAYLFEFCRSEFSSVFYSFIIIFLSYKFCLFLAGKGRKNIKMKNDYEFTT